MCGRYASFLPAEALARIFGTVNPLPNLEPTWNMAPTRTRRSSGCREDGRAPSRCPEMGPDPLFHEGPEEGAQADQRQGRERRQVRHVPGGVREAPLPGPRAVYYEWRDDPEGKTPFAVARVDGEPVAFGGIWENWRSPEGEILQTFATITTDANELLAPIQDRMPVIVEQADWPLWLGEQEGDPAHCYGQPRKTRFGFGLWTRRWGMSGMTDRT